MASIRKRNGKWQARVRIKDQPSIEKTFTSRSDAEAWGKIIESEIIRGIYIKSDAANRMTLSLALEKYERLISSKKRSGEIEKYRIERWKRSNLASRSLASLKGVDFANWRDSRLSSAKPATVRLELALISNLFTIAQKEWGIDGLTNPISSIRMPSVQNARNRLFDESEEHYLLCALDTNGLVSSCKNRFIKPIVLLALETAMRKGELLSLQWENINFKDRVAYLAMTKNGSSRFVPLSTMALSVLHNLTPSKNGAIFRLSSNALNLAFNRAIARARKDYQVDDGRNERFLEDFHFHDLRHIAITRLSEKLPNIIELAAVSGHKDVRMLKRYYHPCIKNLAKKLG